jgi:DNA-binding NarL/FixJ family response regulator
MCPTLAGLKCADHVPNPQGQAAATSKILTSLTPRELQVLRLVAQGAANKQVAAKLEISIKTVEKHRQQLMDKLNIHDTAGLTRYAISSGVIMPNPPAPLKE